MKVVYTEEALRNLDDISDYIRQNSDDLGSIPPSPSIRCRSHSEMAGECAKGGRSIRRKSRAARSVSIQGVLSGFEPNDRNTIHPPLGARGLRVVGARGNVAPHSIAVAHAHWRLDGTAISFAARKRFAGTIQC